MKWLRWDCRTEDCIDPPGHHTTIYLSKTTRTLHWLWQHQHKPFQSIRSCNNMWRWPGPGPGYFKATGKALNQCFQYLVLCCLLTVLTGVMSRVTLVTWSHGIFSHQLNLVFSQPARFQILSSMDKDPSHHLNLENLSVWPRSRMRSEGLWRE